MSQHFEQVKEFVIELGFRIDEEIQEEEIVIINDDDRGIRDLIIDCEDSLLVLEQLIMKMPHASPTTYKRILQMNRTLVFGAFVLDETGETLIYRNTLALENLDLNELESTMNALSMGLAENSSELLAFASGS
jgi:hypothetical protein